MSAHQTPTPSAVPDEGGAPHAPGSRAPRGLQLRLLPRGHKPAWSVVASCVLLGLVVLAALFGSLLFPEATKQSILDSLLPPFSDGHPFGTDELGRDVFALLVAGTASAVVGPVVIALGSMTIGVALGTLAGYQRGWVDAIISRFADVLLALPVMLLAIVVAGIFNAGYWMTVALLILLFSPSDIRIVRAGVLEQAPRPYVEAAQMLSLSRWRIMFVHVLPNVWPLIVTNVLLNTSFALVTLSSLSFLGVGVAPGTADWGRQIADGRSLLADNPAALIAPAVLIVLVSMAINVVGDWFGERLERKGLR
jgi:peptide/nickel transport system permease protein